MSQYQNEVLNEREATHGDYAVTARVATELKASFIAGVGRAGKVPDVAKDSVWMESANIICTKLARIASGDHNCKDTWKDIAGYANLVSERLK
jgi:hypothetical protein